MRIMKKKILTSIMLVALSTSLFATSANAASNEDAIISYLNENCLDTVSIKDVNAKGDDSLPEKFDLRDKGVVTPVKFQNPWGTCWGFAAIAASESSILTTMGKTYEETGLDLSEHHLTYFINTYIDDENDPQYGEGNHMYEETSPFNTGGLPAFASSIFSSGIGVVAEEDVPYRGANSNTEARKDNTLINKCYSTEDDWTLPSDIKFMQRYELKQSRTFESPVVFSSNTIEEIKNPTGNDEFLGIDQSVISEIKREVMAGRPVVVAFQADTFRPNEVNSVAKYLNTEDNKWTHFTFDTTSVNHAVTIVGWDDTIKSSDFLDHTDDEYGDGLAHQPEGDGAWLIKNSWGSQNSDFPNNNEWGIKDENGNSTGYFYMSYYDRSQSALESYEFSLPSEDKGVYELDQYDYITSIGPYNVVTEEPLSMSNVYTAESKGSIRSIGFDTYASDTDVTYQIYSLDDSQVNPENGKLLLEKTDSFEAPGFYKVDLDSPVSLEAGQKYAVVITQKVKYEGTDYYIIGINLGMYDKETADEMNRQIKYANRGKELEKYVDNLQAYYTEAVVNEGESFVYSEKIKGWYDLSKIIPKLREESELPGFTLDNFSIKSYIQIEDEAFAEQYKADSKGFGAYTHAKPAGKYNIYSVTNLIASIVTVILYLGLAVYGIKKYKAKRKEHIDYVKSLEEKVEELEKLNK